MRNKIIAGAIAVLFYPALGASLWVVYEFKWLRVVVVLACAIYSMYVIYSLAKFLLDRRQECRKGGSEDMDPDRIANNS